MLSFTASDHQRGSTGGATAVGQLSAMVHPVHGSHQEHVAPRSEIERKLRRYACDHLIKLFFARALKPSHEILAHRAQLAEKQVVLRVIRRIWIGLSPTAEFVLQRLAGIHDPLHHLAISPFRKKQMAKQPVRMIARAGNRRNERSRLQIVEQREHESSALTIRDDDN